MKSILFVCTGNIFRSMTAEYAAKAIMEPNPIYHVSSAGTQAQLQPMAAFLKERIRQKGIDPSNHRQRKITSQLLAQTDLAIAMGRDHQAFLKESCNYSAPLFNQICCNEITPVLDIWEAVPDWRENRGALIEHTFSVVDHIFAAMPLFLKNVGSFFMEDI